MVARTRFRDALDVVATVAVTVASVAIVWSVATRSVTRGAAPLLPPPAEDVSSEGYRIALSGIVEPSVGNAKIGIVEFSDFQCPFCARHARDTLPSIKREYVSSGRVAYGFVNFPLEQAHPRARELATLAYCARSSNAFWTVHDWLFANQEKVAGVDVQSAGEKLGLSPDYLSRCLTQADKAIADELRVGTALGVNATPTFFLGSIEPSGVLRVVKRISGAVPLETFRSTLDELLSVAR